MLNEGGSPDIPSSSSKHPAEQNISAELSGPVCFSAERYIVTVETSSRRHKILQIMFGKKDGSLYVNFPYFKHNEGLTSIVTIPANITYPTTAELTPGGKATSHLVKYSHHSDGRVHFSQDGRVRSTVRKQSVPLAEADDHMFTVKFQGLSEFELGDPSEDKAPPTIKRKIVNFRFPDIEPEALKIVGRWYSRANLVKRIQGTVNGPIIPCLTRDGEKAWGILLANPHRLQGEEYILLLICEPIPLLDKEQEAALTFIGGFDPSNIVNDRSIATTFLAFTYPVKNLDELARELGSIDFIRNDIEAKR